MPRLHSDHSIITFQIGNHEIKRGRWLWKFNVSLLHDVDYVQNVKEIIKECNEEYGHMTDKALSWDMRKLKIRSFSVSICIKMKKERTKFKKELEEQL